MEIKLSDRFMYRIKPGDDYVSLCERFNTSKENIKRNNINIPLYAGEWVEINVNDYLTHIVKPTEKLIDIAEKHCTTIAKIMTDNNLETERLFIGQQLKIKQ